MVPAPAARGLNALDVARGPLSVYGSQKASLALDVIVVGCGIGGLAVAFCLAQAGHRVTIIESSPLIGEIGAGMQLSPNTTRLLQKWGLGKHLDEIAVRPEGVAYRRYSTGERIGFTKWGEDLEKDYGAPYYHIHRADLHKLLHDLAFPHVTMLLGSAVVDCDPDAASPSVTLKSGEVLMADLIIGADGVKSYIQEVVLGKPNTVELTGDAVYRTTIPTSLMMKDPELREFVEHPQMTAWIGPRRCLVAYPIVRLYPCFSGFDSNTLTT
jgi:salicylate hydroxylase